MTRKRTHTNGDIQIEIDISDDDIHTAMQKIHGYLDITAADFKLLYRHAYQYALSRMNSITAGELASGQVVSVRNFTSLIEVADIMATANVSGVPVLDEDEKIIGIISERDFFKHMGAADQSFMAVITACLQGRECATASIRKATAADIMSTPAITIREDRGATVAATLLQENGINRLPVLAKDSDKLIGILTRSDLVRAHIMQARRNS
ncbi:CBS domain-containing protein [Desulfogranum japonicum]|uniref:CBS domain-containing protein n=1 Tax=Desulfogranum japonicum TaxID=231447 RepID=UPI00068839AE|nr:CBS domain-containing protein [Desulfogranum japonicum]